MKDPVWWWWWCGGGGGGFFVIIIPTPVLVFDFDFDWGVAKMRAKVSVNNGQYITPEATKRCTDVNRCVCLIKTLTII